MLVPSLRPGWQYRVMRLWCWCVVALAACTKPNPEVCCLDAADCASIGVSDPERTCAEGLACVNNACVVASCSTDGCTAQAPVCDITLDVCTGCTGSADCDQFDTKVCDTGNGACVECLEASDCSAAAPVCDAKACRGCRLDSECASGACGDDGACLEEEDAVYVSPTGADTGTCTKGSPCFLLQFALSKTTASRSHIVMANGTYSYNGMLAGATALRISSATTSAAKLHVHGGNSTVSFTQADGQGLFDFELPTVMSDLTLDYRPFGRAVVARAPTTLRRMNIVSETGIEVRSSVNAEDVSVSASVGNGTPRSISVLLGGSLVLKRATLKNGAHGIKATEGNSIIDLENVLVSDTSLVGIDLGASSSTTASLSFVTVVRTGTAATGAGGLICPNNNTPVQSTIVWVPNTGGRPSVAGCAFSTSIVGPVGTVGAGSNDPQFVDLTNGDYHLSSISPAIDLVDEGPDVDFEGDVRPSGARFDIGADEAR